MKNKRGISAIIATVLLILISILAVGILSSFLIPMVRQNLEKGQLCFEYRDYFAVQSSVYTCYSSATELSPANTSLRISRGLEESEIKGIAVSLDAGTESKVYKIIDGEAAEGVSMYSNGVVQPEGNLDVPNPGESKTYFFSAVSATKAGIATILPSGGICDPVAYNIPQC